MDRSGILSADCAPGDRHIKNYDDLIQKIAAIRTLGGKIVLTSGSFDMKHIGHDRYLREARLLGDFLVVGVESDARIKERKGENRPIVPEEERIEALTHTRYVDLVVTKQVDDKPRQLIKAVKPDVLIVSERTGYDSKEVAMLSKICGEVVALPSQAQTSTSARLRELQIEALGPAIVTIAEALDKLKELRGGA